nr:hypothetical protein [Tanacetum cinerariifolium]
MDTTIEQQAAMDEALVPHAQRLRIRRSNFRLLSDIKSKELTLQLVYDVLRICTFFKALLVTADVPEIYMQEFWVTAIVHHHAIRFKMDNKKHIVNLESFRDMLHICPRVHGQSFDEPPFEKEILAFIHFLGHSAAIRTLTDVNIKKLYQPWRSFTAIINNCLTGKSFGYDILRLSQAQILNSNAYKEYYAIAIGAAPPKPKASARRTRSSSNTSITPPTTAASPRLTAFAKGKQTAKASKAKSGSCADEGTGFIPWVPDAPTDESKEELSWNSTDDEGADTEGKDGDDDEEDDSDNGEEGYGNDDDEDDDGEEGNDDNGNQEVEREDDKDEEEEGGDDKQEYDDEKYAEETKDEESFDPIPKTPKNNDDEGNGDEDLGLNEGGDDEQEYDEEEYAEETRDEESFDPIPKTPENSNDEGNGEEEIGLNVGGEEGHVKEEEEDELYRDVKINQGRGIQETLEVKDSHVTLTPVNPDGQQQSSSVSSQFVTSMLNPILDVGMVSIFETTSQMDVQTPTFVTPLPMTAPTMTPSTIATITTTSQALILPTTASSTMIQDLPNFGSLFGFDNRLRTLEASFSEFMQMNQFTGASDRLRDKAQRENNEFLKIVDENIQKIIKEHVKEQVKDDEEESEDDDQEYDEEYDEETRDEESFDPISKTPENSDDEGNVSAILGIIQRYMDQQMNEAVKKIIKEQVKEQVKTSYAVAADLSEMELKKILIEKMEGNKDDEIMMLIRIKNPPLDQTGGRRDAEKERSLSQLEYHLKEVFKATTDQLDWVIPKGQQYPHNLLKPLQLIPNNRGRRVIPFEHFINNDLEYLRRGASSCKYTTSITKTKAADYGHIKWIEDLVPRTMWIKEPICYDKHALWGVSHWGRKRWQFYGFAVNRESAHDVDDDKLYKFKEGDFKRLRIQDIEDMLLLLVQGKLTNLTVEERFAFNVSLRMFTRSIVIQRRVEDLQLGVKSYQKKLNLTKPDSYRSDLKCKEAYTAYSNPRGFIYQNKEDHEELRAVCWRKAVQRRLQDATKDNMIYRMLLLSFKSDGTLTDVRTALDDRLKGIRMQYLP